MTTASFYKKQGNSHGVYFDIGDDFLMRELKQRKQQEQSKSRQADKIINQNNQIKELKQRIQQGYLNKERAKQLSDKQVRRVDELISEANFEGEMILNKEEEIRRRKQLQQQKAYKRAENQYIIQNQMHEKADKQKQAYEQYLRQKDEVQKVMKTLIQSQLQELTDRGNKKKKAFDDMQVQLQVKAYKKKEQEQLKKTENLQYFAYLKQLDSRDEEVKKTKQGKQQAKNKILDKLKIEQDRRRKDVEELQLLRRELHQEEYQAEMRRQEQVERQKRYRQKIQMQKAEEQAKQRKRRQRMQQQRMQVQFRNKMYEKLAQQDRLQQMAQQKRRVKQQQHKREVQIMWQEKLKVYKQQKEREEQIYLKGRQDQDWQQQLIRRQKQKLLREHLPNLEGFLPKQLAKISNGFSQKTGSIPKHTGYSNAYRV